MAKEKKYTVRRLVRIKPLTDHNLILSATNMKVAPAVAARMILEHALDGPLEKDAHK